MTAIAKLPVWKTTRDCYALVFANLGAFVRISWLWILVMVPVYASVHWFNWTITLSDQPWPDNWRRFIVKILAGNIPEAIFLASIAVAWHRYILRNQAPRPTAYINVDCTVLNYATLAFLVFFVPVIVIGISLTVFSALLMVALRVIATQAVSLPVLNITVTALDLVTFVVLVCAIVMTSIGVRFCLKFPALALAHPMSLVESWHLTTGNTLRLIFTAFLCSLASLFFLAGWITWTWDRSVELPMATFITQHTLFSLTMAIPTIFGVTLFSLAYRHFVDQAPPTAP